MPTAKAGGVRHHHDKPPPPPPTAMRLRNLFAQPRRKAGLEYHSRHLVGTDQIDIRHIDIADITRKRDAVRFPL
jgi:hypothetical protein